MMKILVINCGSSSIKYQAYDMPGKRLLARGLVERIGEPAGLFVHRRDSEKFESESRVADHQAAMTLVLEALTHPERGVVKSIREIGAVGHRVVHGGEAYSAPVLIDGDVEQAIEDYGELAPLHNPPNLVGIRAARAALPGVPMAAVFDTAFHQTLPPEAYLYPLPYEIYEKYRIRKYGFHGSSHQYVASRTAELLRRDPAAGLKLVTCHLGNGCSLAAVRDGKSVDTSMGFTPLAGVMMGTRSGDIDPCVPLYLQGKPEFARPGDVDRMLNKHSGLLGVGGVSNDMRNCIETAERDGPKSRAALALDMFAYRIRFFIGAYTAVLGGLDAIALTGGIGENSHPMRARILDGLGGVGAKMDPERNAAMTGGKEGSIAAAGSACEILIVPTDEEGFIAAETHRLCGEARPATAG